MMGGIQGRFVRIVVNFTDTGNTSSLPMLKPSVSGQDFWTGALLAYPKGRDSSSLASLHQSAKMALVVLYLASFLVAVSANVIAMVVLTRYRKLRRISNCLLMTLTVADLTVALICMPTAVGFYVYRLWIFGELMCKLSNYLQGVAVSASIFSMTVMSVDRYFLICHPMTCKRCFCRRHFRWVIILVWITACLIFLPVLFVRETTGLHIVTPNGGGQTTSVVFCVERWESPRTRTAFNSAVFACVFAVPGLVIIFAYCRIGVRLYGFCQHRRRPTIPTTVLTRNEEDVSSCYAVAEADVQPTASEMQLHRCGDVKKVVLRRRIVATRFLFLTIVFAVCWMPYNLASLLLEFPLSKSTEDALLRFLPFGLFLGHVNSAANPVIYFWLNRRFRWKTLDTHQNSGHRGQGSSTRCRNSTRVKASGHRRIKMTESNTTTPTANQDIVQGLTRKEACWLRFKNSCCLFRTRNRPRRPAKTTPTFV